MPALIFILLLLLPPSYQEGVLICKSGTAYAYHRHYCRGLKECTHAVEKVSLQEAVARRRKPCRYCYKTVAAPSSPASLPLYPAAGAQCQGSTKSGRRCSRKAGSSGYCWQHG